MAVIVMRQIPARSAGVAFTVDPAGTPDVLRIEAVDGLGEQLVNGQVTPTVHLVPRRATGGGVELDTADLDPNLAEVASLAVQVEEAFGEPQDLEWARDGDGLWLLQARPITTGAPTADDDGFDTPGHTERRWTTTGIVETVPGVLPPLRWDVGRLLLEEALRHHEGQLGALPPEVLAGRHLLGRIRGRAALDADLLDEVRVATVGRPGRLAALRRTIVALRVRRRALWEAGTMTVAAIETIDLVPDVSALTDDALLALRRRLLDLAGRALAAEVAVASAAVSAAARLDATLVRYLEPDEATAWAGRVTARPGGTVAGWPGPDLAAVLAGADVTAVATLAEATDWTAARGALSASPAGLELLGRLEHVIHRAGSSAVFAGPTWEEQPDRLWSPLRTMAAAQRDGATDAAHDPHGATPLDDLLDGLAANPDWRQTGILTAQVIDVRCHLIRRQAEDTSDLLERRERTKSAVLTLGGEVRRLHVELGRRLAERGVVERPEDVELLGEHELVAAARGGSPSAGSPGTVAVPTLAELARRRRWLGVCEAAGPLPTVFDGHPSTDGAPAAVGDELHGWGASPGRLTGRARVLHDSGSGGLQRGEVLVTRTTDASWAPLFMVAGAVVVEEGGPLSHAAIVARELGIPAVLNLPGIVARLDGESHEVTVDGDLGTVSIASSTTSGEDASP